MSLALGPSGVVFEALSPKIGRQRVPSSGKSSARFYLGLCLMALSYLLGLPAMALCGYLAHAWKEPLILPLGVGAVFVAVLLIFAAGVYLAGANYAKILLRWFASRFLRIHLSHSKRQ